MELNKTECADCGYVNRWQSYKWACTSQRQAHNHENSTKCPRCSSPDVRTVEDDETMATARAVAGALIGEADTDGE